MLMAVSVRPSIPKDDDFSWEGILDDCKDVKLVGLVDAVKAMDGQRYTVHGAELRLGLKDLVDEYDMTLEQALGDVLKWDPQDRGKVWRECRLSQAERAELASTMGPDKLGAIRAWTDEYLALYHVVNSVSRRATSRQCVEKILPYLRLLLEGLRQLPDSYVRCGEVYRGEEGVRCASKGKGDTLEFKTFMSFTTDPEQVRRFMDPTGLLAVTRDPKTGLADASEEKSLKERLLEFYARYGCKKHQEGLRLQAESVANQYEDDVPQLQGTLKQRFGKELPTRGEKPSRSVIYVKEAAGYLLGDLSNLPGEKEVLFEPGLRLTVVDNSQAEWNMFGESDSKRLRLNTELSTSPGPSLLTSDSTVKRRENAVRKGQERCNFLHLCGIAEDDDDAWQEFEINFYTKLLLSESRGSTQAKGATRSAKKPRAQGAAADANNARKERCQVLKELREDVHDFVRDFEEPGWLLKVTVKQHDGKDDDEGERIGGSKMHIVANKRRYIVDAEQLIKVYVQNLSRTSSIAFTPVYVGDDGGEEPDAEMELKCGEQKELPFPLQKPVGEEEDGWVLKDGGGAPVLELRFALGEK